MNEDGMKEAAQRGIFTYNVYYRGTRFSGFSETIFLYPSCPTTASTSASVLNS